MKYALILLIAVLVTACASTPPEPRIAQTPSGMPEATFSDITPATIIDGLATSCLKNGMFLTSRTDFSVTCTRSTSLGEAVQIAANIGVRHSSDPVVSYQFDVTKQGTGAYVRCTMIASRTRPNGVEDSMLWTDNRDFNAIQGTFIKLGGH